MTEIRTTASALAFVSWKRKRNDVPTWFDVGEAYDAGLRHAVSQPKSAVAQLERSGLAIPEHIADRVRRAPSAEVKPDV